MDDYLVDENLALTMGPVTLQGHICIPPKPTGLVLFAHGSGSSRHSPRNLHVARVLNDAGLATLLFDLLRPDEESDRRNVFDVALLGDRLDRASTWARDEWDLSEIPLGYFGASTGAAAALWAAAGRNDVAAVVSRGGRPDLAQERLPQVRAPTLLIVGERDQVVEQLNRRAQSEMTARCDLVIVPRATHLFEEPGALERVAELAAGWFTEQMTK